METKVRRGTPAGALWGAAIVIAALAGARFSASGNAPVAGEPARVCSIDLERVFDSAPQRAAMEEGLVARDAQIREEIETKKKEIDRMKGELDLNRPGTEEHSRIQRELVQKQADLRFISEQFENEMEKRVLDLRDQLLGEIDKVVRQVCDQDGFDIVLQEDFKIPKTSVVWKAVFFTRPAYDITDRVIAALPKE